MRLMTGGVAVALIVLLSGCTAPASVPLVAASPAPAPAEGAVPAGLSCDQLVPQTAASTALAGSEAPAPAVVSPMPVWNLYEWAVMAAGGVTCNWHVGDSATYLVVDVLPDAADAWHGHDYGDGTIEPNRTVAGVETAAACGQAGCTISAPVADAWTIIRIRTDGARSDGFRSDGTRFTDQTDEEVLAGLDVAAAAVFSTLTTGEPERLVWPHEGAASATPAPTSCDAVLPAADLAALTGNPAAWEVPTLTERELAFLRSFAQARAGFLNCNAMAPEGPPTSVIVAPGGAWLVAESAAASETPVGGTVVTIGGSTALEWCSPNGAWCTVIVAVGDDAVQVSDGSHAAEIAEAIVARAR